MSEASQVSAAQAARVLAEAECLFSAHEVEQAIERLATQLDERLSGKDPLVLTVMNGGLIFAGRLLAKMQTALRYDYIHASRYRGDTRGHDLHWMRQPQTSLQGQTVVLLDDILDQGWTLQALLQWCEEQGASELVSAVLVEKRHQRERARVEADFVGLTVEDRYVFGVGMDYHERLRNVDGIHAVKGL